MSAPIYMPGDPRFEALQQLLEVKNYFPARMDEDEPASERPRFHPSVTIDNALVEVMDYEGYEPADMYEQRSCFLDAAFAARDRRERLALGALAALLLPDEKDAWNTVFDLCSYLLSFELTFPTA